MAVPGVKLSEPVVELRTKGLESKPIEPDAMRVRLSAVIMASVETGRVVRIDPSCAVRVRLVPLKSIAEEMVMSPVVWVREREDEVMVAAR